MFKLVIQDDEGKTTVVPLIRDEITIGRKEGNTIRLTERNVSRRHARILRNNGEVQIEDLGSYNGIRVNNARIAERVSLRVSDQVQIGDYKLYLKAEGVEQVDDARTMPIERVDSATSTDVIPAIAPPAPTQPMAIQTPAPGSLPAASQLVGTPNRTMVAVADTDPQGRPMASAAAVAAMSSPVGYGKLVALSSNFAGKEFELSRPQMIVGRTNENDIVIDHRSISRNHAKLVREPETGRYTISDLQSSNGVRVNGQDYGKVELRRGDVVDLGHVRLRFVEPGENFVLRDADITDVPESGGSRKLFVGLAVAALLIGAVVVVMMMRGDKPSGTKGGSNDQLAAGADAGDRIAVATPDAADVVLETPDAAQAAVADVSGEIRYECKEATDQKRWQDLLNCSDKLKKHDGAEAARHREMALSETKAESTLRRLNEAVKEQNLKAAKKELDAIPSESVYRNEADQRYERAHDQAVSDLVDRARRFQNNCKSFDKLMTQTESTKPRSVVDAAKRQVQCKEVVASTPKDPTPKDPTPKDPPKCNADELSTKGSDMHTSGNYTGALSSFEQAYQCRQDARVAQFAFINACKIPNSAKAKIWWKRLSPTQQGQALSICVRNGISQEFLQQ